jgi:hypothetical protein
VTPEEAMERGIGHYQCRKDLVENVQPAPPDEAIIDRLRPAILSGRICATVSQVGSRMATPPRVANESARNDLRN